MQLIYLIVGWPLGWIMWACYKVVPVYAVALVLFTLIMRVLLVLFLFPLFSIFCGLKQGKHLRYVVNSPRMKRMAL